MNLDHLLKSLLALPAETEWIEFKHNNEMPDEIGEYLSALANSAALHGREAGYLVWGIEDVTKRIVGTTANPRQRKIGNEQMENWLAHLLAPRVDILPVARTRYPRGRHAHASVAFRSSGTGENGQKG